MTQTDTGLPNRPSDIQLLNLINTCRILERVRAKINTNATEEYPLVINSAFRSKLVNETLPNSSSRSYHLDGRAVDISISCLPDEVVDKLLNALYDEYPTELYAKSLYIHVAF